MFNEHGNDRLARLIEDPATAPGEESRLRAFALDCAEHVLPIWQKALPADQRLAHALTLARKALRGEPLSTEERHFSGVVNAAHYITAPPNPFVGLVAWSMWFATTDAWGSWHSKALSAANNAVEAAVWAAVQAGGGARDANDQERAWQLFRFWELFPPTLG
jgi:hypothetical protein